jgi:hypothetical protein
VLVNKKHWVHFSYPSAIEVEVDILQINPLHKISRKLYV